MISILKKKNLNIWKTNTFMTKIFIDSDIILDLLTKRNDYQSSADLFTRISNSQYTGYTSPIVFVNVHYIMSKYEGKKKSIQNLIKLRRLLSILAIDEEIIDQALLADAVDFEDSIQYIASEKNLMDFIITRNKKDYKKSVVPALTAFEFLKIKVTTQL